MIKAQDLRIGNKLFKDGIIMTIDAKSIFDIWNKSKSYLPVSLTPVMMVKYGFEIDDKGGYKKDGLKLFSGPDEAWCWFRPQEGFRGEVKLQYLHQLQNLYYALTGEELIVNL